jgi:hypothetical protein
MYVGNQEENSSNGNSFAEEPGAIKNDKVRLRLGPPRLCFG